MYIEIIYLGKQSNSLVIFIIYIKCSLFKKKKGRDRWMGAEGRKRKRKTKTETLPKFAIF